MPGTIQVSVMDFCPPPMSTPPALLKVSLGKREFQTSDKGEFSFPLINLRDNLLVEILDAEGRETAHKGIQTMSIVQKVSWDETFFFDGGGFVHLKLQFVLTEEDRARIRLKREAALKKKQENVSKVSESSDITRSDGDSATSSVRAEEKKSDLQKRSILKLGSPDNVTSPASLSPNAGFSPPDPQSNNGREGATVKETNSKSTDEREGAFSFPTIQRLVVQRARAEQKISKIEPESSHHSDYPDRVNEDSSRMVHSGTYVAQTSTLIFPVKDDHRDEKLKQEVPLERSPSNVRNLVRAFESSQTKDSKSSVKVEAVGSGTKIVGKQGYAKDYYPKNFSEAEGRQRDAFIAGDLRPTVESSSERGEGTDSAKNYINNMKSEMRETPKKLTSVSIITLEDESTSGVSTGSPKQLERLSPTEKSTFSGRMHADPYEGDYSSRLSTIYLYSGGTLITEGRRRTNTNTTKIDIPEASIEKSKSLECYEEEHFYSQHSGLWIFPNNAEPLCVTAAGKWVRNLLGSGSPETKFHQKKKSSSSSREGVHQRKSSSSSREREKDFARNESVYEMHNPEECQSTSSSSSESSPDNTSGRLFGQLMKIAIIVGFGVLVFVTRQREPRKNKRERDELLLASSEFMNEQSTVEE